MTSDSKRNPWLAMLASLLMPGLGQVYNGKLIKGLFIFISLAVIIPLSAWLVVIGPKRIILYSAAAFVLLMLLIYVYAIIDAGRDAKRTGSEFRSKPCNRAYIYVIFLVLGAFIFYSLCSYRSQHLLQLVKVPSHAMLPNVFPGEYLLVDKRVQCRSCRSRVQNGQMVIFHDPKHPGQLAIRRIIGLPGDKIEIKANAVTLNGVPTRSIQKSEFNHAELDKLLTTHNAWREKNNKAVYNVIWPTDSKPQEFSVTVPDGKVFVMSDNREDMNDSRSYGSIAIDQLTGVAEQVAFSTSQLHGIRWWRIGTVVDAIY